MRYLLFSSIFLLCFTSCGAQSGDNLNRNPDGSITLVNNQSELNSVYLSKEGNLGIGKQDPTDKLEVNGQIHARAVKVDLDEWADTVFKSDYDLVRLREIEKFIETHGHLPEIPSAKTVLSNGIELGEMNRLLLLKIEELTLHLIAQDKKIEQLADQLQLLSSEVEQNRTID